jgi:hypothetical protein
MSNVNPVRRAGLVAAAAAITFGALSASANTITSQGVTFTTTAIDADSMSIRIQDALTGGTGNWLNITHLWLLGIKDIGTPTGGSVSEDATVAWSNLELDGNGACGPGSPPAANCFTWATPAQLTDDFTFTLNFVGGPFNFTDGTNPISPGPHIKVGFLCGLTLVRGTYNVCGSILSQNIPTDTDTDTDTDVSEPGSLALLGLGLLAMGFRRRRRPMAS